MERIELYFVGVDSWCRPVFKRYGRSSFWGIIDSLMEYGTSEQEVLNMVSAEDPRVDPKNLRYFGTSFDCEPEGGPVEGKTFKIVPRSEARANEFKRRGLDAEGI